MSTIFPNKIIKRLVKVNSVDFVSRVFECYQKRDILMIDSEGDASNADLIDGQIETLLPKSGGGWFNFDLTPIVDNAPAQIIFSSGTEGRAKAIVLSHTALANVVERLKKAMQLNASIREYIGAPVTYSFGLGRCRAIAAVGGSGYIPENGFNLSEIQTMLEAGEINAISAVPSLWRVLLQNSEMFKSTGQHIRWIEIGSQYMSADEKRMMKSIFPNANILQHYGLTEASRSTLLDISSIDEQHLESVGSVDFDDIEIQLDKNQRIKIRGAHTALGRIDGDQLIPLVDSDGWLTTNDTGAIKDGFLYYLGRHDDIVNCSGVKVDPESLQQKVNLALKGQCHVAICGVPDQQRGEGFFIAVNNDQADYALIRHTVNEELAKVNVRANDAIHIQYLENIPKTETGKVRRKELAALYTSAKMHKVGNMLNSETILGVYQETFVNQDVTIDSSFESLGGDSLNFVQLSISIEKILGQLPENWETLPVNDLEHQKVAKNSNWSNLETGIILRASAIICIVLAHSGLTAVGGGTYLLFLLIGANFARFQFKEFVAGQVWDILPWYGVKIFIPYVSLAVVYSLISGYFDPRIFLLIHNFWSVSWTILFPFWFVQVLIQCMVLLALLMSIPVLRRALHDNPWRTSYSVLIVLLLIRFSYPLFWDTVPQSDIVAPRFLVYIWLGWTLYVASELLPKLATSITGVVFAIYDNNYLNFTVWLSIGCILLPLVGHLRVPRLIKWLASYIAASTFYIFIFNGPIIYSMINILGIDIIVLNVLCAISFSMLLWYLFENKNIMGYVVYQLRGRLLAILKTFDRSTKQ